MEPRAAVGLDAPIRLRRGLFRKYVLYFVTVVCTALFVSGAFQLWFAYEEQIGSLKRLQTVQAEAAAARIDTFIAEIERQMQWTVQLPWSDDPDVAQRRYLDARRLFPQVEAITELAMLDPEGVEQLHLSRIAMDVVGNGLDRSADPAFIGAVAEGAYYGPLTFRYGSEPFMSIAVSGKRRANGVAIADVNLKFIWDLISKIEAGESGLVYVVDRNGRLLAHPDIDLVLRNTDYSGLRQVAAALASNGAPGGAVPEADGGVISAYASLPRLGWFVFVESPVTEALRPIYLSLARTGALLLLGLSLAVAAGFFLARRMVGPIQQLQAGAALVGAGEFHEPIRVTTGDELEALAGQFNEMAESLRDGRSQLENRVAQRTAELAEKTRQLGVASAHKSQFLANMSHELRTPLNAILGYTELILDDIYGPVSDPVRDVLTRVQVNGAHLLQLINTVLDLSKIEAGALELEVKACDLGIVVAEVAASMESLAQTKGLVLTTTIGRGLPLVLGDTRRLAQVAFNVIGNAIKFTDHGSVEISVSASAGGVQMVVRDSGPGIAEGDLERIFDEFQQGPVSIQRASGGTGLGLAISRHIAELHGGTIDVRSTLGQGATFRLDLPAQVTLPQVAE